MKKIYLITRQELINTFSRPSYIIFAFVIPVVSVLILAGVKLIQGRSTNVDSGESISTSAEFDLEIEGYVDQGGLIHAIPDKIPVGQLIAYQDEEGAKQALMAGEIAAYYVIPADYVEKGEIYYVYPDSRSYISDGQDWVISWTLTYNLMGGDMDKASWVWNPIRQLDETSIAPQAGTLVGEDCSRPGYACESNELVRAIPAILVALFYMAFMASSSMLFNSIGSEKENRTIEVLMLSINSRQLLAGKTIGLGIAGLFQTVIWMAAIFIIFNLGGSTLSLPDNFTFPVHILVWSLVFFFGGYALYASLMAGAGAMVPKMKEAGIANFIVMLPLFLGYMIGLLAPLAESTRAALPIALSFFPFTAPVVMVMRLADSYVPFWQLLLSAGLTYATAYFTLRAVAAMFHAQNLLTGQPFSVKRYFRALFGRA